MELLYILAAKLLAVVIYDFYFTVSVLVYSEALRGMKEYENM